MKNIVKITNMNKSFFGTLALHDMNFQMDEGEVRCLAGENGCGKSTMIKMISGFYTFDSGELFINGKQYHRISPAESIKEGVQVIYQDFSLFPNMTIGENIMMYSTVSSKKVLTVWPRLKKRAREVLQDIRFEIDPDRYVAELSVAEKQMVAISRAIVQEARLLIMDEPTTALTKREVKKLFEVIRRLKERGVAILFVSHKMDEVLEICDSITIMRNGTNILNITRGMEMPNKEEIIYHMTGKRLEQYECGRQTGRETATPLMEVKHYTRKGKFRDISFKIYSGEILGITGLLGCGRGELAKALFGIEPADSGSVFMEGKALGRIDRIQQALDRGIAYVPEDRLTEGLHLDQSISDNCISRVIGDFTGRLGILKEKELSRVREQGFQTIAIAGFHPEKPVKSLSGGNQQKVVLIKWLASHPRLLILNCPTVGVDVGAKSDIHKMIRELAWGEGIGILVISDDIYEMKQVCSRMIIMENGSFLEEFAADSKSVEEIEALLSQERGEME